MGGNIGGSLLPFVESIREDDWVVLELSSFMLEGLREDAWSPHIAVLTNLSPNHLDWHGSMENYAAAKRVIFEFQRPGDVAIREPRAGPFALAVPGQHNQINAGLAAAAVGAAGFEVGDRLADFRGLPHRLAFVAEVAVAGGGAVRCYDDSKSTTPEAAGLAVEAFAPGTVRIILGGYDKGSDFAELAELVARRCAGVYTIGATGDTIAALVEAAAGWQADAAEEKLPAVRRCGTLDVAVQRALDDARASGGGGVLVLSPGCASWDQFANYEERGERFAEWVRGWGERG
jgi:UDP-N-acetylmuramoylalanine--D-glutamate ligase